ncbi:MAG: serine/threonine protein kinase [Chloroflexi bacterium]|nr:serine/threonine protein kinase [Chloroflexota bacterium]
MNAQALLNSRYRIDDVLGKGGMAVVYRGRDLMLERDVAIKVLREDYSADPNFRERFREEAKAAANLSHPNIVTVYDFGFDDNRLYIVMEFIQGKDLNTIVSERGRLRVDEGIHLAIQACAGIGFAHRSDLVHCDVKPHNFLVTPDQRLKVTDFGIARVLSSIGPDEEADVVWGSPQYFSPEQAGGSPPSPASDVYSLGVVLYHMFTGQLPFIAGTSAELAKLHRRAAPIRPREINPLIPSELEEVILKVLSKEPSQRYRTADQLGRVLQTISGRLKGQATPPQGARRGQARPTASQNHPPNAPPAAGRQAANAATRPQPRQTRGGTSPSRPVRAEPDTSFFEIDWAAVTLGLVALLAVGGLFPFWFWVYNVMFSLR